MNQSRELKNTISSCIVSGPNFKSPTFLEDVKRPLDVYLLNIIRQHDGIFLIDHKTKQKLTRCDLVSKAFHLATALQSLDFKPNTVVGIVAENCLEYSIVLLATWLIGGIVSCHNAQYTADELEHTMIIARPSIVFSESRTYNKVKQVEERIRCMKYIVPFDENDTTADAKISFSQMIHPSADKIYHKIKTRSTDTAVILYSSGTTGPPKGVMYSHLNWVFAVKLHKDEGIHDYEGNYTVDTTEIYHVSGFLFNLLSLVRNETRVMMGLFDSETMLSIIEEYKIRFVHLVPSLIVYILDNLPKYDLSSLKYISYASASLKSDLAELIQQKMNLECLKQMYGLTEGLTCLVQKDGSKKPHSCGSPVPGVQAKVVHSVTGEALGPHQKGELCFRGPNVMQGYCNNIKATTSIIDKEGWLRTGDLAFYDEEDDFFIVGRLKELIKYDGYQVTPWELEAILMKHEAVKDAGIVGVPDDVMGELPKAFVVKKSSDSQVTANELVQYVAGKLGGSNKWGLILCGYKTSNNQMWEFYLDFVEKVSWYKHLRGGVTFVEKIPRNSTGKILRKKLKE